MLILGRSDAVRHLIPSQIQSQETEVLANRMDLREGFQTASVQRLGNVADALHTALCQSLPAGPGGAPVIRLFPAWPREWDAQFQLLCRGGFLVGSSIQQGEIEFVEIVSQQGGECRLRNPWQGKVQLHRNGKRSSQLNGSMLTFETARDERLILWRDGTDPNQFRRSVP